MESLESLQNFFFLVYISDPRRSKVKVFADGDVHAMTLSWDAFLTLVETSSGSYDCSADIKASLATYGTPWLYDRKQNKVLKISPAAGSLKDIGEWVQTKLAAELAPAPSINPASRYAEASISSFSVDCPTPGAESSLPTVKKVNQVEISIRGG